MQKKKGVPLINRRICVTEICSRSSFESSRKLAGVVSVPDIVALG